MAFLEEVMGKFGGVLKAAKWLKYIAMFRAVHWRKASESPDYATCAVCDLAVNVDTTVIKGVAVVVNCLKALDPNVDTDHPVFQYMSDQYQNGQTAALEVTISIRKREGYNGR